ncbi:MAG: hypothetical protein A3E01_03230 [Gammaproteobacteria bacterium RIFCSPHIGHO2_12_FULL_63_22]|nr:MAG: hypothetical protein A3E01_03230 [Gammaproteobacteria bacterium RIFCSPHIGHO2_12_FULL_63_22]
MAEDGVRVALLARAGKARDQLRTALDEAGASVVAEGDPLQLDPAEVAAANPNYYLVSLEPAIETALERFDDLLAAPGVEVMFDDAEVTSKLDGWDLNRWARHLASKMLGHEDMPPVPADSPAWPEAELSETGAPPTPAQLMDDARLEDYTADTVALADSVPMSASLATPDMGLDMDMDLDLSSLDFDLPPAAAQVPDPAPAQAQAQDTEFGDLDFDESVSFSSFSTAEPVAGDLDADVAELAAQLEAFDKRDHAAATPVATSMTMEEESIEAIAVVVAPAAAATPSFDFSNLALAPMESDAPAMAIASSPLPSSAGLGAVVILAGLGGPDAVRQLLSSLPESLSVPVLLYQHLEVGKHERLVEQLAKISKLPVVLALDGGSPEGGKVTLLPAGLSAQASDGNLSFSAGTLASLLVAVSAPESMVIVLSGADAQLVPAILAVRDGGGLVLAQDPEVCFDSAAADAMQRQGAPVYPALGLARQIAARWPA